MKKILILLVVLGSFLFALSTDNILALSWENTYCKFHPKAKECKIRDPYTYTHFTLHGLWPYKKTFCNSPYKFKLSKQMWHVLQKYMPAAKDGLARHEWVKHGTCFGSDANTYFLTAIKLTQQFNETMFIDFFDTHLGGYVSLKRVRFVLASVFGKSNVRKVQMICRRGYISEIRIHLKGDPVKGELFELMNNAKPLIGVKQCQGGIITEPKQ